LSQQDGPADSASLDDDGPLPEANRAALAAPGLKLKQGK